jgi:hypothetical protein
MLGRLLNALDPRTPSPEAWLREGWPALVPLVIVGLLPALLAAPIRVLTGAPLWLALALGAVLTVVLVAPFRRAFAARHATDAWITYGFSLLVAGVSMALMFNRDFAGLPSYESPDRMVAIDAAAHVLNSWDFARANPDPYAGFVSLYAFWNGVRYLTRQDYVVACNASLQLGVLVVAAAPFAVAFAVLHRFSRRAFLVGATAALASAMVLGWYVLLPLQSMQLVGGFWPHLFALIPLLALWLADALVRPRVLRVIAVVLFAVLYRYTYGLHLAELLAAVAALVLVETAGPALPLRTRIAGALVGLAVVSGAVLVYQRVAPIFGNGGWIVAHDLNAVWRGELIMAATFAFAMWFWPAREAARGSGIVRALRFPALFAFASALMFSLLLTRPDAEKAAATPSLNYYFQKQDLHAAILTACAATVLIAFAAAQLAEQRHRKVTLAALLVLLPALAGQVVIARAVAPYRAISTEIAFGAPPYPRLRPWIDVEALARIPRIVSEHHAQHGGGYVGSWAMSSFLNAALGHGHIPHSQPQPIEAKPGYCVFSSSAPDPRNRDPRRVCESYHSRWNRPGALTWLCAICY